MERTLAELLRSPVGRNAAYWVQWADEWRRSRDFWDLYKMCVLAALRLSEGDDTPEEVFDGERCALDAARLVAEVLESHPLAHRLAVTSSPQIHFGDLHVRRTPRADTGAPPQPATGRVVVKPHGVFWTSSLVDRGRSSWQAAIESSYVPVGPAELTEHCLFFEPQNVRIFTIDCPADVWSLVTRYATCDNGRHLVDWGAVAREYDAVHLTFRGLLTAQGVPVEEGSASFVLHGWDAESVAWFNCRHFGEVVTRTRR
ncbi:hypothetical protein ACQPZZ_12785 [Microbispora sp. CA-135349]|uniref:hypothetical protein n=1 Tax=Microbispora sp. CA-135349 TaxID=3239953 RepID=UPI003D8E03D0